ncbi:MAG: HAMP domain-containing histidine kinase [Candidatus Omnitrophica bacterium]|nr:HAMP domain-containing histidine kinase [Candidatus Omnitrophota bacterium]
MNVPIKPISSPLVILYPLILTYAIIRHRFLDIQKLIKNTIIFSLLYVLLLGFVAVLLFLLKETVSRWIGMRESVAQGLAIALAIALYTPLKNGLSRITHRMLYQHSQNPEIIFRALSGDLMHILDASKLMETMVQRISQILSVEKIAFYTRTTSNPYALERAAALGFWRRKHLLFSKSLVLYLEKARGFLVSPLTQAEGRRLEKQKGKNFVDTAKWKLQAEVEIAALGGITAFPVFGKGLLRGILLVGAKKSDMPWREEEFQILASFMRHLALAFENADYAETIRRSRYEIAMRERDNLAGAIIAAVDHEAKNPIHAVSLNLGTLIARLSPSSAAEPSKEELEALTQKIMKRVMEDIQDVSVIIEHLSNLADKKPLLIQENVRPRQIVQKVMEGFAAELSAAKIKLRLEIPEDFTLVCDPAALTEIFVNLLRNAIQATTSAGEIIVESLSENGKTFILQVKDTGSGIPPAVQGRIFEPFFTTKQKGDTPAKRGTGMGLFIVKEYMQGIGGRVEVQSKIGRGTIFRLHFPLLDSVMERTAA